MAMFIQFGSILLSGVFKYTIEVPIGSFPYI
jgi:hypothetical protein